VKDPNGKTTGYLDISIPGTTARRRRYRYAFRRRQSAKSRRANKRSSGYWFTGYIHRIGLNPTAALHYATIKSAIKGFYIKDKKANTYASQEQHQAA